jgi:hypothetical protein
MLHRFVFLWHTTLQFTPVTAVYCSYCSLLQLTTADYNLLQFTAVYSSLLQFTAVYCSLLKFDEVYCGLL